MNLVKLVIGNNLKPVKKEIALFSGFYREQKISNRKYFRHYGLY